MIRDLARYFLKTETHPVTVPLSILKSLAVSARFGRLTGVRYNTVLRIRGTFEYGRGDLLGLMSNRLGSAGNPPTEIHVPRGGTLVLGDGVRLAKGVQLYCAGTIRIGNNTFINTCTRIYAFKHIRIGNECGISWNVQILDSNFHYFPGIEITRSVEIGDRVWIGSGAMIMKGVRIGDGSVVAAGSVITKDVPPGCLVAGVPGRIIRENVVWSHDRFD